MSNPGPWEELLDRSIRAFYEGNMAEGQLACDQLLCMPDLPQNVFKVTHTNQVHYAQQLRHLVPSYREATIRLPLIAASRLLHSTITPDHGQWLVLCKIAKFSARSDGSSGEAASEAGSPTDCLLTLMNADLDVIAAPTRMVDDSFVSGSGYCHLVQVGAMWVAAQVTPPANAETPGQLALFEFVPSGSSFRNNGPLLVADLLLTNSWLPATFLEEVYLIDLQGSTAVLRFDASTSSLTLAAFHDAPYAMKNLRGVSQWVSVDDGLIALAKDDVIWDNGAQTPLYRVVRCDASFRITHLSHPFRIHESGAEAGGLAILNGVAAFTFVVEGRTLHVGAVDVAELMALLKPVTMVSPMGGFAFAMTDGLLALLGQWAPASSSDLDSARVDELPVLHPETIIERMQNQRAVSTPAPTPPTGSQVPHGPATDGHPGGSETYDDDFYSFLDATSETSAGVVVPFVTEMVRPTSVVDLGCGTGAWLAAFRANGVEDVLGIDGSWVPRHRLQIPNEQFLPHDLCYPLHLGRRFDLAVSLETAEHLAPECATTLVASLVGLAPAVLFSAAVPGQGGTDHRNLQWPRYWSELFADHDFVTIDAVRPLLCRRSEVAHWYVQNTFLFVDRRHAARDEILRSLHAAHGGPPFPWIHQDYWDGPADSFAREMRHVRAALFTPVDLTLT